MQGSQQLLEKVATTGLSGASKEEMVQLACAYWHEDFVPDSAAVEKLSKSAQVMVGYLTEFFSTFNCVEDKQAEKLLNLAEEIKARTKPVPNKAKVDEIAQEWGVEESLRLFIDDLLFYQTRHYKHKKGNASD